MCQKDDIRKVPGECHERLIRKEREVLSEKKIKAKSVVKNYVSSVKPELKNLGQSKNSSIFPTQQQQ